MITNILNEEFKSEFFSNYFGKSYLHKKKIFKNFKEAMNLEILNNMLSIKNIWNNRNFVMMLDKKKINFSEYSSLSLDLTGNSHRPDVDKVQKFISKGASIVLNDIENHNLELLSIAKQFQEMTQGKCQGNLYFSMESHQAFGPHCDEHDVFAIHFEGEKVWNIYENIDKNPINHPILKYSLEERVKRAGKLINQITLKPGDLLYLPRGQYHDALASKNGSIHIAFGLTYFKNIDLMASLWENFILNDFMRGDIKLGANDAQLKDTLVNFSKELNSIITSNNTLEILKNSVKAWPYKIKNYSLKNVVADGRKYYVSKLVKLEKNVDVLYLTNGQDKVKVPDNYSKLTEHILKQEFVTHKSLAFTFSDISNEVISECLENLKKMLVLQ